MNKMKLYANWASTPIILHFIGIDGSGKTTLINNLCRIYQEAIGECVSTIDWDPDIPDHESTDKRAFCRVLDQLNNMAESSDKEIHQQIVQYALSLIDEWKKSNQKLILVDRWYESYDNLPVECIDQIEDAIDNAGFKVKHILLLVEDELDYSKTMEVLQTHLECVKEHRSKLCLDYEAISVSDWVKSEFDYQKNYIEFCDNSPFDTHIINTTGKHWGQYTNELVSMLNVFGREEN